MTDRTNRLPADPIVVELARRRLAAGLTQQALAERLGNSSGNRFICKVEGGLASPTLNWLRGVLGALGLDLAIVAKGTDVAALQAENAALTTQRDELLGRLDQAIATESHTHA